MLHCNSTLRYELNNRNYNYHQKATEFKEKKTNPNYNGNFYILYYDRRVKKPDEMYKEYNAEYYLTGEIDKAPGLAGIFEAKLNEEFDNK